MLPKSIIYGVGLGIFFGILAFSGIGFYLGSPLAFMDVATAGRFLTVVIIAAVFEELIFRLVLLYYLFHKVSFTKGNFWLVNIIQAVVFSLFHVVIYGSFVDKNALFVSAIVFGLVMGSLVKNFSDGNMFLNQVPNIVAHSLTNLFIIIPTLVVIAI